jgi:dolichol-phosphate mannosyltransferase
MTHALRAGAQLICQMDADLSHNPEQLPSLVAAAGAADVAVGSRYVAGGRTEGWPLRRRALSAAANAYVRWVTGLPVADATSGFKCWRREALGFALARPLTANGYALQFEMLYRAWTAGSRLVEVPISFVDRTAGRSKMSASNIVEAARAPFRIVAAERRALHNRQPDDRAAVRTDSTAQPRVTPTQQ